MKPGDICRFKQYSYSWEYTNIHGNKIKRTRYQINPGDFVVIDRIEGDAISFREANNATFVGIKDYIEEVPGLNTPLYKLLINQRGLNYAIRTDYIS